MLDLHSNKITSINKTTFSFNKNLKFLRLDGNNFLSLHPDLFKETPLLETLFLNNTNLSWIHQDLFKGLRHLAIAHLHDNKITFLPRNLFQETNWLFYLDIHENRLQYLSKDLLLELKYLEFLDISNNRFACTCLFVEAFDYMKYSRVWKENNFRGNCLMQESIKKYLTCSELPANGETFSLVEEIDDKRLMLVLGGIKTQYLITFSYSNIKIPTNSCSFVRYTGSDINSQQAPLVSINESLVIEGTVDNRTFMWQNNVANSRQTFIQVAVFKDTSFDQIFIVRNGEVAFDAISRNGTSLSSISVVSGNSKSRTGKDFYPKLRSVDGVQYCCHVRDDR